MDTNYQGYYLDLAWRPEFLRGLGERLGPEQEENQDKEGVLANLNGFGIRLGAGFGGAGASALDSAVHLAAAVVILGTFIWVPATIMYCCAPRDSAMGRFSQYCNLSQGLKHLANAVAAFVRIPYVFFQGFISGPKAFMHVPEAPENNEEPKIHQPVFSYASVANFEVPVRVKHDIRQNLNDNILNWILDNEFDTTTRWFREIKNNETIWTEQIVKDGCRVEFHTGFSASSTVNDEFGSIAGVRLQLKVPHQQ